MTVRIIKERLNCSDEWVEYCPKSWQEYKDILTHLMYCNSLDNTGHCLEDSTVEDFKKNYSSYEKFLESNGYWQYKFIA